MDRDDQNEAGIGLPLRLRFADQLDQPTLLERVDRVTPREIAGHCLYRINFGSPGDEAESHEGNTYAPDREDAAEKIRQGWEQGLDAVIIGITELAPAVAPDPSGMVLISVESVVSKPVEWLWEGRIPLGKITVLDGDPGLGKSTITLDLAARVTRGLRMPDDSPGVEGRVILISAEDDPADTIRPRLEAAGADLSRVHILPAGVGDKNDPFSLPDHLPQLRCAMEANAEIGILVTLVILDPLMALLSSKVNSHRDQDVRRAMAPLKELAQETGAAFLLVRHLNKTSIGNPLYRGGGSIGIGAAARSGLLVGRDPGDDSQCVLASTKSNLSEKPDSIAYRIEANVEGAVGVEWLGRSDLTAEDLVGEKRGGNQRDDAVLFLEEVLQDGPVRSTEVQELAGAESIAPSTLRGAQRKLGVITRKAGFGRDGHWEMSLPAKVTKATKMTNNHDSTLGAEDDDAQVGEV